MLENSNNESREETRTKLQRQRAATFLEGALQCVGYRSQEATAVVYQSPLQIGENQLPKSFQILLQNSQCRKEVASNVQKKDLKAYFSECHSKSTKRVTLSETPRYQAEAVAQVAWLGVYFG